MSDYVRVYAQDRGFDVDVAIADLVAAVREGVESGTIEGEVVRWCVKHNSLMFTNHGETCHMTQVSAYRLGRSLFDRITCDVVERLVIPVGGSDTQ